MYFDQAEVNSLVKRIQVANDWTFAYDFVDQLCKILDIDPDVNPNLDPEDDPEPMSFDDLLELLQERLDVDFTAFPSSISKHDVAEWWSHIPYIDSDDFKNLCDEDDISDPSVWPFVLNILEATGFDYCVSDFKDPSDVLQNLFEAYWVMGDDSSIILSPLKRG